ncbi:MAG: hypothetical protein FGM54_00535, partial [Chitinophagaceae bacterium]|nr:hypothetical protein [Chitinophagaceae bacterium]
MIIVVNVSTTYKAGMSCCEVRSIAHRAWAAGGLLTNKNLRDKTKYLIAVSRGVVVGIFCIKAVALDPSTKPGGLKKVAFWLICVTKDCYD